MYPKKPRQTSYKRPRPQYKKMKSRIHPKILCEEVNSQDLLLACLVNKQDYVRLLSQRRMKILNHRVFLHCSARKIQKVWRGYICRVQVDSGIRQVFKSYDTVLENEVFFPQIEQTEMKPVQISNHHFEEIKPTKLRYHSRKVDNSFKKATQTLRTKQSKPKIEAKAPVTMSTLDEIRNITLQLYQYDFSLGRGDVGKEESSENATKSISKPKQCTRYKGFQRPNSSNGFSNEKEQDDVHLVTEAIKRALSSVGHSSVENLKPRVVKRRPQRTNSRRVQQRKSTLKRPNKTLQKQLHSLVNKPIQPKSKNSSQKALPNIARQSMKELEPKVSMNICSKLRTKANNLVSKLRSAERSNLETQQLKRQMSRLHSDSESETEKEYAGEYEYKPQNLKVVNEIPNPAIGVAEYAKPSDISKDSSSDSSEINVSVSSNSSQTKDIQVDEIETNQVMREDYQNYRNDFFATTTDDDSIKK